MGLIWADKNDKPLTMREVRFAFWSLLDRVRLPGFIPEKWMLRFYRRTLDGTERNLPPRLDNRLRCLP